MSREIEFRMWKDDVKRFEYFDLKSASEYEYTNFCLFGGVPEQYSGLKDKNGEKIYEGDIVQIPDDWDEYGMASGQRYEVYFAYGGFRCKPWGGCKRRGDKGYWIEDSEDFEVIGNIHENPELLQKYKELDW